MTPNEIRQIVGMRPANDAAADELRNRNINQAGGQGAVNAGEEYVEDIPDEEGVDAEGDGSEEDS